MYENRDEFKVARMARVLGVTEGGYYAWLKRKKHPCKRELENRGLSESIRKVFEESNSTYGAVKISKILHYNHKRVARLMKQMGLVSKVCKKYRSTTYSAHHLPVAENVLNREFEADRPAQKMVSDITYIPTDEGWLYLAAVLDLCGRKVVGMAMDGHMKKELVCDAFMDAKNRTGNMQGCIIHSDRGIQYCSNDYQKMIKDCGCICSMSRKGNCWDNAPMECFWGKMKQEWLNDQHFRTRNEAKKAVFDYIWVFYNRQRVHQTNDYLTPEEYYTRAKRESMN